MFGRTQQNSHPSSRICYTLPPCLFAMGCIKGINIYFGNFLSTCVWREEYHPPGSDVSILVIHAFKKSKTLVGFSVVYWMLFYYMVGGTLKKNLGIGMGWLQKNPQYSRDLLKAFMKVAVEYAPDKVLNGAYVVQIFEATGMRINN